MESILRQWADEHLCVEDGVLGNAKRVLVTQCLGRIAASGETELAYRTAMPVARVLVMDYRELYTVYGTHSSRLLDAVTAGSDWVEQKAFKLTRQLFVAQGIEASELQSHCADLLPQLSASLTLEPMPSNSVSTIYPDVAAPCVAVVEDPRGEGNGCLVLVQPVEAFTPLITVPSHRLFNLITVQRYCALGNVLSRSQWRRQLDNSGEAILLACLVYERYRGAESHWAELLRTCPREFPMVPTLWDEEELQLLSGTSVAEEVYAKRASLEQFAASMLEVLRALALAHSPVFDVLCDATGLDRSCSRDECVNRVFTREQFSWAQCVFDSRAFHLNYREVRPGPSVDRVLLTLAPIADMVNHTIKGTHILTRRIDANGNFVLETGAALQTVNRELVMGYGPLQNWELLLSYGFVPTEANENDRLPFANLSDLITVVANSEDRHYGETNEQPDEYYEAWRWHIVIKHHLNVNDSLFIPYSGVAPPIVRAVLRLCQAEAAEFPSLDCDPFAEGPAYLESRIDETLSSFAQSFLDSIESPDDSECDCVDGPQDSWQIRRRVLASRVRRSLVQIARRMLSHAVHDL